MTDWLAQLPIVPVALPLVCGAWLLLLDERRRGLKSAINAGATLALLAVSIMLLHTADAGAFPGGAGVGVYLLGNWPAPFGIVLVVDRLAALMLTLTAVLAVCALCFSLARWHRAGAHYHSLFQFLLMGVNGAFLTGDLFNLFVFFEVMLAASYGLVLHGSGIARVKAGLHYIAVNLAASLLFLIGASLVYGVAGTLNMAHLAARVPELAAADRTLLEAAAGVLGVAFLVKAGMWPLCFWLPNTYAVTAPPAAALFAILSKVGVYILLRLWLLVFGPDAGDAAGFGGSWLLAGGMMTVVFGSIGALGSQDLPRLASFNVLVSSGTVLAVVAVADTAVTGAALFYLLVSTLALSALFLLVELVERGRAAGADVLAVTMEAYGETDRTEDYEDDEVGIAIPATMAVLGISFACCALLLAGLPPLAGFVTKFLILAALFAPAAPDSGAGAIDATAWALMALLLLSGLAAIIAMTRAGIRIFWLPLASSVPRVRVIEIAPVVVLLLACLALTIQAGPVMRFMRDTADSLHAPHTYTRDVLTAPQARPPGQGGDR